jgi:hypothetical protein
MWLEYANNQMLLLFYYTIGSILDWEDAECEYPRVAAALLQHWPNT